MITPAININGTSPDALFAQYNEAREALLPAIEKLIASEPHGRDYPLFPPMADSRYQAARAEHLSRVERLTSVMRELDYLAEYVSDRT